MATLGLPLRLVWSRNCWPPSLTGLNNWKKVFKLGPRYKSDMASLQEVVELTTGDLRRWERTINTGWWSIKGGGMMWEEDWQTLRLCWAPTGRRCRWGETKSHLIDLHLGGRVDLGAGGGVDEARQGERLCFNDGKTRKAGGARQVEVHFHSEVSSVLFVESELPELVTISSKLASGVPESLFCVFICMLQ